MNAHQNKDVILWLIVLIVIVSAIVFYRVGFHRPVPAFNGEKVKSLQGHDAQEVQTPPKEEQSDASSESTFHQR